MAYEKKDGDISIFANDKQGNDKRPDFKGSALIDGKEYDVALWTRQSQTGKKYISGSIKLKQEKQEAKSEPEEVKTYDDSVPW